MGSTQMINEKLARYGIVRQIRHEGGQHATYFVATCQSCDCEAEKKARPDMPPDALIKRFSNMGWHMTRKKGATCPACLMTNREEKDMTNVKGVAPSPKIARKVFGLLDDVFDEEKCVYRNGYSDQKVADECKTSLNLVESLRKEAYGELAMDPKLQALVDDFDLLKMEIEDERAKQDAKIAELGGKIQSHIIGPKLHARR